MLRGRLLRRQAHTLERRQELKIPRISVRADFDGGVDVGEVSAISLGYGIHQAWIYSTMFGTSSLFGIESCGGIFSTSSVFLASIIANVATLLICGCFDTAVTRLSVKKYPVMAPMLMLVIGTSLVFLCDSGNSFAIPLIVASGILTGIGSAVFLLYWGIAFARMNLASIITNTIISYTIAALSYSLLAITGAPCGGIVSCLLPVAEAALAKKYAPKPYNKGRGVPFFNHLPVRRLRLGAAFGLPMLFFGVSLGYVRTASMSSALTSPDSGTDILQVGIAAAIAVIVLVTGMALLQSERVEDFLRPVIPVVAIAVALIPFFERLQIAWFGTIIFAGYICFAAVMWITFAAFSQQYRLSPVFVFGLGRGSLSLGSIAGIAVVALFNQIDILSPYSDGGFVVIALICIIAGQALLPRQRDIRRVILANNANADSLADDFNLKQNDPVIKDVSHNNKTNDASRQSSCSETAIEGSAKEATAEKSAPGERDGENYPIADKPADTDIENGVESSEGKNEIPKEESEDFDSGTKPRKLSLMEQIDEKAKTHAKIADEQRGGFFRRKCEAVANQYLLSARETEVLFYLAKGYKSAYIQQKLYISEGTAKTHIRHIYGKANVHSQQELMRLVNETYVE